MGHPFRLGRVFGIELRVDPSWLVIFALVTWSLTALFGSWHPDWSGPVRVLVASSTALVFFASVVFHELAHAAVASLYGVPVRHITLHLFGGVANIEREPPTPAAELFIAIVGPIASVGLGISMLLVTSLLLGFGAHDVASPELAMARLGPVATALAWLGPVNIVVGLFNLIPGFPLDGGRVFRAIVWRVTNSLQEATRIAAGVGQGVGWIFVGLGVLMTLGWRVPVFGTGFSSGLWLGLIGLFLRNAAIAQLRSVALDQMLLGVRVGDVMRRQGRTVSATLPVRELVNGWFMRHDEPAYPVFEGERFVGIVSVDDVRRKSQWDDLTVTTVMTGLDDLITTTRDEDLAIALRKLASSEVRQLPVLDRNGKLVGMLFEDDVLRWLDLRPRQQPPIGAT
jgi:Zn-dependent protease